MEDELRKIDLIRERTRLSYERARALLQEAGGDVVAALILWERRGGETGAGRGAGEVVDRLREVVQRGNRTMVRVFRGDQTYLEIPVTVGVMAAALAPYLAVAGAAACVLTGCSVRVQEKGAGREGAGSTPDSRTADGTTPA
ncbi:MAG: DUF4342 domain-containing protein [Limnochordaceae bacterium]|nr:DUF4342 domain-containing protein [Limnochordaceae bacterium]